MRKFQATVAVALLAGSLAILAVIGTRDEANGKEAVSNGAAAQALVSSESSSSRGFNHIRYE